MQVLRLTGAAGESTRLIKAACALGPRLSCGRAAADILSHDLRLHLVAFASVFDEVEAVALVDQCELVAGVADHFDRSVLLAACRDERHELFRNLLETCPSA